MKKSSVLFLLVFLLPTCIFCITKEVQVQAYKVDIGEVVNPYIFSTIWDPSENDLSVSGSSQVEIAARGASGDGIVAFTWVLYGNLFGNASVSFDISPMTFTDDEEEVHYLPFTMTFVCGNTMISHFTVPYNSASPISNSSFVLRQNNNTYTYQYSDYISSMTATGTANTVPATLSAAKKTLSWTVNPGAETHTGSQSVGITYNLGTKSVVSIGNNVINSGNNNYPSLCNQWNRSGTAYIKVDINANAEYTVGGTVYTAVSGIYRSTVTVTFTGV